MNYQSVFKAYRTFSDDTQGIKYCKILAFSTIDSEEDTDLEEDNNVLFAMRKANGGIL